MHFLINNGSGNLSYSVHLNNSTKLYNLFRIDIQYLLACQDRIFTVQFVYLKQCCSFKGNIIFMTSISNKVQEEGKYLEVKELRDNNLETSIINAKVKCLEIASKYAGNGKAAIKIYKELYSLLTLTN